MKQLPSDPLALHTGRIEAVMADIVETMRQYARLADPVEFNRRYEEHLLDSRTYEEAYRRTEQEHHFIFQRSKYSGYNSFRVARTRKLNASK